MSWKERATAFSYGGRQFNITFSNHDAFSYRAYPVIYIKIRVWSCWNESLILKLTGANCYILIKTEAKSVIIFSVLIRKKKFYD